MMRWLHKMYAGMFGYFWEPCPICGKMFGGHEEHGIWQTTDPGISEVCCRKCADEAARRNIIGWYSEKEAG